MNCQKLCLNFPVFVIINVCSLAWVLPPNIQEITPHCMTDCTASIWFLRWRVCLLLTCSLYVNYGNSTKGGVVGIQTSLLLSFVESSHFTLLSQNFLTHRACLDKLEKVGRQEAVQSPVNWWGDDPVIIDQWSKWSMSQWSKPAWYLLRKRQ